MNCFFPIVRYNLELTNFINWNINVCILFTQSECCIGSTCPLTNILKHIAQHKAVLLSECDNIKHSGVTDIKHNT